ncbi:hypothetical protein INT47_005624 [Mucor saturninus]|uniref:Uncharacterized protein n=1 Tax=Mucor saturninus TaxID=64648 RepID=A0A8H7UYD3_9FUNG|nr:hypothetical protein INT47_005624 [Mucor saturninus]
MLSPYRFYEDSIRIPPFTAKEIPLKQIHDLQKSKSNDAPLYDWKIVMNDESYELSEKEVLKKGCATVTCIVCYARIQSPWKEYTEWRTNHSVALQCHCCNSMFTVKHVGKANLLADNTKVRTTAGLLLDSRGIQTAGRNDNKLLLPIKNVKGLPFNEGLRPLRDQMARKKLYIPGSWHEDAVIDAIQSTYLCTPYRGSSIDLIQAVARQYKFAVKVTKSILWDAPTGIIRGIRHYNEFLNVIKDNHGLTAVPTLINHDDTIPEEKLKEYVERTDLAWSERSKIRTVTTTARPTEYTENLTAPTIVSPIIVEENPGIKTKFKQFFSSKKKKTIEPCTSFVDIGAHPKMASTSEKATTAEKINNLIGLDFMPGSYTQSNPYRLRLSESSSPNYAQDKDQEGYREDESCEDKNEGCDNDEEEKEDRLSYEKEKVSFHDRRDIKEFITLESSDSVLDNTDYLDQWDENIRIKGF